MYIHAHLQIKYQYKYLLQTFFLYSIIILTLTCKFIKSNECIMCKNTDKIDTYSFFESYVKILYSY